MSANRRILVVDDQQDIREHMSGLLTRSARKNESASLVQQMRMKLMGGAPKNTPESEDDGEIYEVDSAEQGQFAFEMVRKALAEGKPYALLFLDMRMPPGWDGLETAQKIREIDKNIEIVIMTAYADHDQATIAKTVGTPEKLLYIKKPFQAEEISQLALCLTGIWNTESDERCRKAWLENVVRGMSRLKSTRQESYREVCSNILKLFLTYTRSEKGFFTTYSESKKCWILNSSTGMEPNEAETFVEQESEKLSEARTTQLAGKKFFLPLRRDKYAGVAVVYDVEVPNDPEWYKLLTLLTMNSCDLLIGAADQSSSTSARTSQLAGFFAGVASSARDSVNEVIARLNDSSPISGVKEELTVLSRKFDHAIRGAKLVSCNENGECRVAEILRRAADEAAAEFPRLGKIACDVSDRELSVKIPGDVLREAFRGLFSAAAGLAGDTVRPEVNVKAEADDQLCRITFRADVSPFPEDKTAMVFEPAGKLNPSDDTFGLALPLSKHIFHKYCGALFYDSKKRDVLQFNASLPSAEK